MRVALGLEYDGSRFFGFQRQRQRPTVQEVLEQALARVANHSITIHCAGRTDTGVHALGQVVHFDSTAARDERAWVLGANTNLPAGVAVLWSRFMPRDFHARFSARGRAYRYRILNRWIRPGLASGRLSWDKRHLDVERMHEAAQTLVGEHDFSSFRAPGCQARGPVRTIYSVSVKRERDEICIDVHANAFLYHMVRIVVGTLTEVGAGKRPPEWVADVLRAKNRMVAGPTATADGLYFMGVKYPEYPDLPANSPDGAAAFPRGWNLSG